MCKRIAHLCTLLLAFFASRAFADLAAIHRDALPQDEAVLAAFDDAQQLEPYTSSWYPTWTFPVSKKEAAKRLGKDLDTLDNAAKSHPENVELQLLTSLVARYAYNVDVPNSPSAVAAAFKQVHALAPNDVRGQWFHASFMCQTNQTFAGAQEFLSIESAPEANKLPPAFWDDYIECATVTNMPAHALRAVARIESVHAPVTTRRTQLEQIDRNRFISFDGTAKLEAKDVWYGSNTGANTEFTSTLCGVRLAAHGDWKINQLGWDNGSCIGYFSTGPYKATEHILSPSILVLVQQPKPGETLQIYLQKFLKKGTFVPYTPSTCPAAACLAMKGIQSGTYGADGDGHPRIIAFERDQPEFPGLIFEAPQAPPTSSAASGPNIFRPAQTRQRIPGKLFYIVLLDTAASIEEPAMKDFDFFLKNLEVE